MSYWWHVIPMAFFIMENNYFGWNGKSESESELMADGLVFLMFILVGIGTHLKASINLTIENQVNYHPMDANEPEDPHL